MTNSLLRERECLYLLRNSEKVSFDPISDACNDVYIAAETFWMIDRSISHVVKKVASRSSFIFNFFTPPFDS